MRLLLLALLLIPLGCSSTAGTGGAMSDEEIATFAVTVLGSQADLARLAAQRASTPELRGEAAAFEREASPLLAELRAWLAEPPRQEAHSETTRLISERARRTASVLRTFEGETFDREYQTARSASARYLLDSLARVLSPYAEERSLRTLLERLEGLTEKQLSRR